MKVCFVLSGEKLFGTTSCFPSAEETATFCRTRGDETTILFADADAGAATPAATELKSWRGKGFSVHSLVAEKFMAHEPFFPAQLRNAWLTYRWLKLRDFDRIVFRDDSSAGLISFAAKRLGEAFAATRLIYQMNGPESWSSHLRDRRHLVHDDVLLPYSVQYGVENADELVVPTDYFVQRIEQAGWVPSGRVSMLPYLLRPQEKRGSLMAQAALRLIYPIHDSDYAPLTAFLKTMAGLLRDGQRVRISFLCHGDEKQQRQILKRVRKILAGNSADVPFNAVGAEFISSGEENVLWLFSALWLNLPFPMLEVAQRGDSLLIADTPESRLMKDFESCRVEWTPAQLSAQILRCLEGMMPRPPTISRATAEKAWNATVFDSEPNALPPPMDNADKIRVSVCVAHFNKARDLREALDSLKAQTHPNLEVIVVDDCSTDPASLAAFDAAATAFASPDWKFIHEDANRGPGYARNRSVSVATGSHVLFFDADDVAFPDMVERLLRAMLRSKAACVAGSSIRLRENGGQRVIEEISTYVGGSLENAFVHPPAGTVFIIGKDTFNAVGGFESELPEECHEDWNFHVRLLARDYRLHVLPEPVFAYRSVPLSRSVLVPHDMTLLLAPLVESTPQVRRNLINLTIARAGALETAVRLLSDYGQFARGIRFLRFLERMKRSLLRPFRPRRIG